MKINLRGLQRVLSEKDLKNVMGGSVDPENLPHCCYCSFDYEIDGERFTSPGGWVCGDPGDSDCYNGKHNFSQTFPYPIIAFYC